MSFSRLEKFAGMEKGYLIEMEKHFSSVSHFPDGFKPLKNTDHFKSYILYALTKYFKPSIVIETGVASGTSSLGILKAIQEAGSGHLYSIDLPNNEYTTDDNKQWKDLLNGQETGSLVPQELRDYWTLQIGNTRDLLPKLILNADKIDLFYHDSEHTYKTVKFELECVKSKLSSRGVICVDNVNWNNAFVDFCKKYGLPNVMIFPYFGIALTEQSRKFFQVRTAISSL